MQIVAGFDFFFITHIFSVNFSLKIKVTSVGMSSKLCATLS